MESPETRIGLIAQLKDARNEQAWAQFVADYQPFLRRLVTRQGVPQRHVDDVTQQVFAAISHSVSGWKDDGRPGSFRRWAQRVARNIVIKFMQKERKQLAVAQGGSELIEQLREVEDQATPELKQRYEHEMIVWAAEQIREEFRSSSWQAFWGTVIEGRSVSSLAQELNISAGAIYMSRSRIMARIKQKIERVMSDGESQ